MNKIIRLDIDEEVLAKAERIAAARHTTVDALVRDYLAGLADTDDARWREAVRRMKEISKRAGMEVGPITWSRDDIHKR